MTTPDDDRVVVNVPLLRIIMRANQWNQDDLARALGVDKGNLSRTLRGITGPSVKMISALTRTFPWFAYDELIVPANMPLDATAVGIREERAPREAAAINPDIDDEPSP